MLTPGYVSRLLVLAIAMVMGGLTGPPHSAHADAPPSVSKTRVFVLGGRGSGVYSAGQVVPISANAPPAGTEFRRWFVWGGRVADATRPSTQLTVYARRPFVVAFALVKPKTTADTFDLSVVNGTGSGAYKAGAQVSVSANQAPAGQVFKSWAAPAGLIASPTKPQATFAMPALDTRITAVFEKAPPVTAVLTVTGGTGSGTYAAGTPVTVQANAAPTGKIFDKWTGDTAALASGTQARTVLTMPKTAVSIAATYKVAPVAVTIAGGTPSGTYTVGQKIAIAANPPAAGMKFSKWTGATAALADASASSTTMTVPAPATPGAGVTVTATYEKAAPVQTTVTVTGGTGSGKYTVGTSVVVAANTPPAGQVFDKWTGTTAGLASTTQMQTNLIVPATAVAIAAAYKPAPVPTVAVTIAAGTPSGTYKVGQKVVIAANAPPAGMIFSKWTGATAGLLDALAASTTLTVPSPATPNTGITITATYQPATSKGGAVVLSSHKTGDPVATLGETVFGTVSNVAQAASLQVVIAPVGRTQPLEFDKATGRFAVRLFEGDAAVGTTVTLTFTRTAVGGAANVDTFSLVGAAKSAALQQIAGRLTFGATPALLNEIRTVGYPAWVAAQLNPNAIADTSLEQMKPEDLLKPTLQPYQYRDSITAWRMAYATYSQRQLREVMTTFWKNHFWSTEIDDNADSNNVDEINGFRANAFGKFRDLLRVSTHSPMMMYFLDNDRNSAGNINENYARELLELHTVGVNGGYGNTDIIAVARILTGWGARQTTADGVLPILHQFEFRSQNHDTKDKVVPFLNKTIKFQAGTAGVNEGEELLDILAMHPKTQAFVCGKLVEALVSDAKPQAFIDACVAAWSSSGGNMGAVIKALLTDPAYLTTVDFQRSKVKTPYETAVAFIRNFGIYPNPGKENAFYDGFRYGLTDAGMDIQYFSVPTGFREDRNGWANTASFIKKFQNLTTQVTYWANPDNKGDKRGLANYTMLLKSAEMTTAQAAAAYLLALGTSDRYRKDEYDLMVDALRSTDGFDLAKANVEARIRKTVGLLVTLPSYQLQ